MKQVISKIVSGFLVEMTLRCAVVIFKTATSGDPSLFGMRCFYLVSGSMEPTLHTGCAVIVRRAPDGVYAVGDVITFVSSQSEIYGQPNTHRIIAAAQQNGVTYYYTQGDANPVPDSVTVTAGQIYGKVIWNSGRAKWFGTLMGMLTTPMGFVTMILLPVALVAIILMRDFMGEVKAEIARQAAEQVAAAAPEAEALPDHTENKNETAQLCGREDSDESDERA